MKKDHKPLSRASRIAFFQTLSVMLGAGIPVARALRALETNIVEERLRTFSTNCRLSLEEGGATVSLALQTNGVDKLTPYQLGMIKVAESSGTLDACLTRLALEEEESWRIQQRIASALVYPLSVFVLVSLVLFLLLPLVIFPGYLSLIEGLHIPEEGLFGSVLWFMRATQGPLFWSAFVVAVAVAGGLLTSRGSRNIALRSVILLLPKVGSATVTDIKKRGGEEVCLGAALEELCLVKLPSLGRLVQAAYTARFARALEIILRSGGSLTKGLELAAEAGSSNLLTYYSKDMVKALEEGTSLSQSLQRSGAFPSIFLQMVAVGEESGQLAEMCDKSSSFYQEGLVHFSQDAISVLEPLLTGLLGLVVGAVVLLSMYPILMVIRSL